MPCPQTLAGIAQDCTSNMGGIVEVLLANQIDISNIAVTSEGKVTSINAPGQFYRYLFRRGTGSMTSTLNRDPQTGSDYWQTDVVLQFSKMETAKRAEVVAMSMAQLTALVKDANGKWWLLGYNEPVTASAGTGQTGQQRNELNGYNITLTDYSAQPPYEVDASTIDALVATE